MASGTVDFLDAEAQAGMDLGGLDPTLAKLGAAVGLLLPGSQDGTWRLNTSWFANPISATRDSLTNNGEALADLLGAALGAVGGTALGIPLANTGDLGTWYPILNPSTHKPTGLFLVARTENRQTTFALGVHYDWPVTGKIAIRAWGMVPVVQVGGGTYRLAMGQEGNPILVGLETVAPEPLVNACGVQVAGMRLTASLNLTPQPNPGVTIVAVGLQLPGETKPKDRPLSDLKQFNGEQILSSVSSIFVAAMADELSEKEKGQLTHLLPVLGLSSVLPQEIQKEYPDASIPLLRWEEIFSSEHPGQSQTEPIRNWFSALLSNSSTARAWLTCVQHLLGLTTPESVSGQGSRDNPWSIPVVQSEDGTLFLRVATAVDADGARTFYPGLSFRSPQKRLTETAALQMTTDLELAQFRLSSAGVSGEPADIRFAAGLQLVGAAPGDALFEGTIKSRHYRFGGLRAGVKIGSAGGSPKVIPFFTLTDVATPDAAYPLLDLTQPSQVMSLAEAEAARQIHQVLEELFDAPGTPSHALAVLWGIVPPEIEEGVWPLIPPLSETGLLHSWKVPLAALADYYYEIVTTPRKADEPFLFTYIVRELATLLQLAAPSALPTITGGGTNSDPWKAPLTEAGSASVFAYIAKPEQQERCRLVMGIDLGLTLEPQNTKIILDFAFEFFDLDLARNGATVTATPQVFPGLALSLSLPDSYNSPEVAGASISVEESRIEARWSRYTGWSWSMEAGQPKLFWSGREYPLGQDLVFTQREALMALVQQRAATFGPILTGILGRAAIRGGDRLGIAVAGILGLLPNAGELCPPGLTWPSDMPTLAVTSFEKPFELLRRQLAGICSKPANLKAALHLLSWAFSKEKTAPAIPGSGSRLDPFVAPLGWAAGIGLALWTDSSAGTAGLGIARQSVLKVPLEDSGSIQFANQLVVRLLNVSLASGESAKADGVPGISLSTRVSSSSGHLLDVKGGASLDSILVGLDVTLDGSLSELTWTANPRILLFNLKLADQNPLSAVDLIHPERVAAQIAQDAFQAALHPVLKRAMVLPQVERLYKVLTAIGLTLPADQNPGINPAGWRALLASPTKFISRSLLSFAADPATRAELFVLLREWTDVTPPAQLPDSVLELLAALELATPRSGGFVPIPAALLQFFAYPASYLQNRFAALIADHDRLATLLAALQQTTSNDNLGPFRVQILSGPVVQIGLPAILASESLSVSGNLTVSLNSGAENFRLSLNLKSTELGIGLESALNLGRSGSRTFQQFITFGDGATPGPPPLQIWPFDSGAFVKALAEVAPFWGLSALVSQVVDPQLLQPPPGTVDPELNRFRLAQTLFSILGVAEKDGNGTWHTKSLLGLFDDPVRWLLSDAVFGSDGRLNIKKLRDLLDHVPEFRDAQLTLKRTDKGIRLAGLPYGFEIALVADPDAQRVVLTPSLGESVRVAGGAASFKTLSFNLSLGPDCQPGFSSAITFEVASPAMNVTAGYDKECFFRVACGNPERKLQLVPFEGWRSLLPEIKAVAVQTLLPELSARLLEGLKQSGSVEAVEFAQAFQAAADKLKISELVADLLIAGNQEDELQRKAFGWLVQRFATTENAKAVTEVVKPIFPRSLSIDGQRIAYTPFSSYPLTIYLGAKATKFGLWASFDALGKAGPLTIRLAETGIAIPFDFGSSVSPDFSFGLSLAAPVRGEKAMPLLSVAIENGRIVAEFDPLSQGQVKSGLCLELLPVLQPRFQSSSSSGSKEVKISIREWVQRVIEQAAPRYLALIAIRQQDIRKWLDDPVFGTRSPLKTGTLLSAAGLLTPAFELRSFSELQALTATSFLGGLLKTMMQTEIRILEFGDKGDVWIGPGPNPATDFGIRMAVRNLRLNSDSNVAFHLGAEDSRWIEDAGGPSLRAGIGVYLPIDTDHIPLFSELKLQLVNVGVDVAGTHGEPLLNMSRFRMDAVKPRCVLIFDFARSADPSVWGVMVTAENIGVSLAPNSIGSGGNPVAQNLLGSGASDSRAGKSDQAANPPFSFRAGYLKNGGREKSTVELIHDHEAGQEIWFPLQSQFGPVHVNMLGVKWNAPHTAGVGFDGDVSLAGLTLALQALTLSFDVFAPTDYSQYHLDLGGINLSFNNGPVAISGAFLKRTEPVLQYMGAARMQCSSFTLQALGSYGVAPVNATAPNGPKAASLFIFAALHTPLGGPPVFYVTGVAAGFGYNRDLAIPSIGEIQSFPLVAAASDPKFLPSGEPTQVLERIAGVVPPRLGTYWAAAGVQFTSFELLHTVALLFVRFGQSLEMNLVGLSYASLPPKSQETLAYLELGILASFKPEAGSIVVQAQLTPNSYLLSPSCKLTGGFAFVLWFNGDFVVTLGGYHPMFKVPPSYPSVPRLGFNWPMQISPGSLKVEGTAYFALTPTAIMAGGYLRVAYDLGPIRAWLNASADFLIQWKPFYYDIAVSISVGVEFHTSFLGVSITLSASLGAALHVWGPETAGSVDLDWYVVSFTIPIGSQQKNLQRNPLKSWDDFANAFLPPATDGALLKAVNQPPGAALTLSATEGTVTGSAGQGTNQHANAWAVNLSKWQLRIGTAVPATSVSFNGSEPQAGQPMGVRPMNVSSVTTPLDVRLKSWDSDSKKFVDAKLSSDGTVIFSLLSSDAPTALWGKGAMNLNAPPVQPFLIGSVCAGATITGQDFTYLDPVGPIPLDKAFSFTEAETLVIPGPPQVTAQSGNTQSDALASLQATIMAPEVIEMRGAVLAALGRAGIQTTTSPQLQVMAAFADAIFQAPPLLAPLGIDVSSKLLGLPTTVDDAMPKAKVPLSTQPAEALDLVGGIHRYSSPETVAPMLRLSFNERPLRLPLPRRTGRWVEQTRAGAPSPGLWALRVNKAQNSQAVLQENVQVAPGSSLLFRMKINSTTQAVASISGDIPVRLWQLNEFDEIIGQELAHPGRHVDLLADVASLALQGEAVRGRVVPNVAVGWQRNSLLTQAGRYTLLGDGCVVRPQATPLRMQGRRHITQGVMDGECLLRGNQTDVGGMSLPGWTETMLDGSLITFRGSVAVALRGIGAEAAADVSVGLVWTADPWQAVYEATVRPTEVLPAKDGCILIFRIPAAKKDAAAQWLAVLVEGSQQYALEGVWGVPTTAKKVSGLWPKLTGLAVSIEPNRHERAWSAVSVSLHKKSIVAGKGGDR